MAVLQVVVISRSAEKEIIAEAAVVRGVRPRGGLMLLESGPTVDLP